MEEFAGGGVLARAREWSNETIAANGLVCLRVNIGRWLAGEFPAASAEFMARIERLPWGRFGTLPVDGWHDLELARIAARTRGQIAMRHPVNRAVMASPVWRVGPVAVRLSVLMAVAKLPRVEMTWDDDRESPIFFRFSGGRGIIAADRTLWGTVPARSIHQGQTDRLSGQHARAKPATPKPSWTLPNWPPVDHSEF